MWLSTLRITFHELVWFPIILILKSSLSSVKRTRPWMHSQHSRRQSGLLQTSFWKATNYTNNEDTHFPNSIVALTLFLNKRILMQGVCVFVFLPRWRGAENQRRNNEVTQKWQQPQKVYHPNRETRRGSEREPRGWCLLLEVGAMKGWTTREMQLLLEVPLQSETKGKKHPTLFSLPTTHLQPVIPR